MENVADRMRADMWGRQVGRGGFGVFGDGTVALAACPVTARAISGESRLSALIDSAV